MFKYKINYIIYMKKKVNIKLLLICLFIVYFIAFIGSLFTSNAVKSDWYQQNKPSLTPPSYVFPIVWNVLFFLIAYSLYFTWTKAKQKNLVIIFYGINFVLNASWSYFYFYLKNPLFSFIELIFLWMSILSLLIFTYKIDKKASYLLIPYFLWVSFAGILNYLTI